MHTRSGSRKRARRRAIVPAGGSGEALRVEIPGASPREGAERTEPARRARPTGGTPRERALVAALVLFAALRVWAFAFAFPFFTNVDEHRHVDMALKYARGYWPLPGEGAYEREMVGLLARASPEYATPEADAVAPPLRHAPPGALTRRLEQGERLVSSGPNLEAFQPPVYYALAGGWLRAARAAGAGPAAGIYAVRALGGVLLAALVAAAWVWLRAVVPEEPLLVWGVPSLLAVFPMDAFFYVTPDAASPALAGGAVALALGAAERRTHPWVWAAAGALGAVAFLAKYTNALVVAALAVASVAALARRGDASRWRGPAVAWAVFALPCAAWLARNRLRFGSFTASEMKLSHLGWGTRSPAEWLGHPLSGLAGWGEFLGGLVPLFWRGEIVWRRDVLALPAADAFYVVTTALGLALAAASALRRGGGAPLAVRGCLAVVALAVAELALLSLSFAFHATSNPPADHPFFVHGRLVSGALLPFAVCYVWGVRVATSPLPPAWRGRCGAAALGLIALVCLASELWLSRAVFHSAYNLYAVP